MNNKLQQAQQLINQEKFKKALPILKKINQKVQSQSYHSLELEGICLIKDKKYQMAELILQKSLAKAENNEQKCNTLTNLKSTAYSNKNNKKAIDYIKQLLLIDRTVKTAELRLQLCQICYLEEDFQSIIDYAPKLYGLSEYSALSLLISIAACAQLNDKTQALHLYDKLLPEIESLLASQVINLIESMSLLSEENKIAEILDLVKNKFAHEPWFKEQYKLKNTDLNAPIAFKNNNIIKPKERIVGNDKLACQTITNLINQLESLGANFHKDLRFIECDGDLSITSFNEAPQKLMSIPLVCMPLLSDFNISILDNKIIVEPIKSPISPQSIQIMHSMVDLYNQTDKISSWKKCYPLLALRNYPELVEQLFINTKHSGKTRYFKELFDQELWDELTLKSFIGSREYYFRKEILMNAGIKTKNNVENGLLTVIDFLNHKEGAASYLENKNNHSLEIETQPDANNNEIFVQYNFIDTMLSYLVYGFVDISCSVLFSCITELTCKSGLTINVQGVAARTSKNLSNKVQHIEKYMPATLKRNGQTITLNNLIIPSNENSNTLPQVLKNILMKCDLEGIYCNEEMLKEEISHIEKQLVLNNLKYWQAFKSCTEKNYLQDTSFPERPLQDLRTLYTYNINHLNSYAKAANVALI